MAELVAGMVQGIGEGLVAEINERASGIPLYAVELVRMLIADGDLVKDDGVCCTPTRDLSTMRVPDTVRAVIEARLDRLALGTRELLQDAAVLGTSFTHDGLAAMAGLDGTDLTELLDPLVHRELLEIESDPRSPERGEYRFVQSMIREVAYGRLTRDERRVRHIRAAELLTEVGDRELAGAVAGHYMAAHRVTSGEDEARALTAEATAALSEAAARAAGLHSHAQALAMIEQALEFAAGPREEAALWQRAARSASALARHETAVGYAYRALDWYQEHGGETEVVGAAALVGEELCNAFRAPEAIDVLEPIVAIDSAFTQPAFVSAGAQLARAYLMALRDEEAASMGDRIIGPAERLGLVPTIVNTLITRGTALGNRGRMHEAVALLQGATRFAQDRDLPVAEMRAANNLGHLLAYDDHVDAMEACHIGMEQANRLGDVRFIGSFTWAFAAYLDRDGRYGEGQALRDDVRERVELPPDSLLWYELTDLTVRVEQGDAAAVDPAYDAVRRSVDNANPQSPASVASARAKLHLLTGKLEAAFDEVMNVGDMYRFPDHYSIATISAALLGDIDRLEAVAKTLRSSPVRGRMVGAIESARAGAVAALRGDTDEAVLGFSQALAFRYFRIDRANVQALFATLVGRSLPETLEASDAAFEVFADSGATAYFDLYAAGLPRAGEQRAAGQ
jgi:tetratricopeptide (TPR) repeat protein